MTEKYWIDIETADGDLVTDPHADTRDESYGVEVDLPENHTETSGEVSADGTATRGKFVAPPVKKHMGIKTKSAIVNTILYIVLIIMAVVWLIPFFGIVCESFRCDLRVNGEAITTSGKLLKISDGVLRQNDDGTVDFVMSDGTVIAGLTKDKDYLSNKDGTVSFVDKTYVKKNSYFVFLASDGTITENVSRVTGQVGYILPQRWGLDNYVNLFKTTNFGRWFLNTFIMGVFVCVLQTLFVLSVSYSLSRMRFKGRKGIMNFMLILGMFPGFLTLILLYKLLSDLGLTGENAMWGLIIVYVASSGMGYYVSKGFFDTIPKSLDEAARIDGANRFQVFYKVIMPMAKPIVIYTILMGFMAPWGDFVTASYIAHNTSLGMNVAVGLNSLISTPQSLASNYTMFCAGGVVVAVPITLLFLFLQKYYVEGVTGGAVKG